MLFLSRFNNLKAKIFEDLILFDKTTYKVYGENVPLAVLINELTFKGVEQLIEQGGVNFALWTPMIAQSTSYTEGLIPVMPGRLSSDVHTDPECSIDAAFDFMKNKPNKKQRNHIKRKVRDLYILPKVGIENEAQSFAVSAFNSNKFESYGLDCNSMDIHKLSTPQKSILTECATDLLEYKFLISENLTSFNSSKFSSLFNSSVSKIEKSNRVDVTSKIASFQNFPNLQELSGELGHPLQNISKLRDKTNVIKFRRWLSEVTTECEMKEVTAAYIDAIANAKGFFETKSGRLTKNVTMTAIGAGIGSLVGPAGTAIGGVVGKLAEPVVDFGLDLIDEYLVTELTKGWTPRMFFEELEKFKVENKT